MPSKTVNAVRGVVLLLLSLLLIGGGCGRGDPPGDGGIQLFYDVNVDDAVAIGLESLSSVEITTTRVTALMGTERILGSTTATTTLPARNQLLVGAHYATAPGFITQLRIFPSVVRFHFKDGTTADVRVPSAQNTGWKVTVDEAVAPNGYEVTAGHVTGIRLFMNLGELFHSNKPQGWMARPTISPRSTTSSRAAATSRMSSSSSSIPRHRKRRSTASSAAATSRSTSATRTLLHSFTTPAASQVGLQATATSVARSKSPPPGPGRECWTGRGSMLSVHPARRSPRRWSRVSRA
jgi:hypothetical protein